jgi:DNA-directed RNA polymerase sigma subunit (sigma70/sigma32)
MDSIIERLRRNALKQKEYRHIVRGRSAIASYEVAKRQADIYFLRKYAGLTLSKLAAMQGVSPERVRQIGNRRLQSFNFTICHPKKSCM